MKRAYYVGLIAASLLLISIAMPQIFGLLSSTLSLNSSGSLKTINIKAYSDSGCTTPLTSINWGTVEAGQTVSRTLYLKNEGTATVTVLMSVSGWNPSGASAYINIAWNREGATITVGQVVQATITCSVSSGASGISTFSVNIVITGTG